MAKYADGTNYSKSLTPSSTNLLDPGTFAGKVRVMQDTAAIDATTTMKSSDYLLVGGKLPIGAQVVSITLSTGGVGTGTDGYLLVGDEGDPDRYMTKVQSTTAGVYIGPTSGNSGINYVVTGTTDNYIRISGSASAVCINSTGTVKVVIMYAVE